MPRIAIRDQHEQQQAAESSQQIAIRVKRARDLQQQRRKKTNALLNSKDLNSFCQLDAAARDLLLNSIEKLQLSSRAHDKILRVARTVADLAGEERIAMNHVAEAITYRKFDIGRS